MAKKRIRCPHCLRTFAKSTRQQSRAGNARTAALSPERRKAIAQAGAKARWAHRDPS